MRRPLTCVEICAGAGGQALGLAMAGFVHVALVEYEQEYCNVLKANRPEWNGICADVHKFDGHPYEGVDLLAGGVPCPPFSVAGKQLGKDDERDLFPEAIRLIREIRPRAVMLENVRGFLDSGFEEYRDHIFTEIKKLGYVTHIKLLNASEVFSTSSTLSLATVPASLISSVAFFSFSNSSWNCPSFSFNSVGICS